MRTYDFTSSASAAAIAAAFPRGPRIAFAPDTGAGAARPTPTAKPPAAKKDDAPAAAAPEGDKMDRILALMQTISEAQQAASARLDALEKAKPDPDAKTAEEKEAEEADDKPDAKPKADTADLSRYSAQMETIRGRMTQAQRDAVELELATTQAKADAAYNLHGKRAPAPLDGETTLAYRVRLVSALKRFSPAYKGVDLMAVARADRAAYDSIEATVYADSAAASERPEVPAGELLMRTTRDITGRQTHTFHGPQTFVRGMRPPVRQFVKSFNVAPPGQA